MLPCVLGARNQPLLSPAVSIHLQTEMTMTLTDLLQDVRDQLPATRLKLFEDLIEKYGGNETFQFTLALVAGCNGRERRLLRMLIAEMDRLEAD